MEVKTTPIQGLLIIQPKVFTDARGYFFESYSEKLFKQHGIDAHFVQDNQSLSQKGALRGLHFQAPPYEQGKLVRVIKGAVLDVVVDIRKNSPTYGEHFSLELSEKNFLMLWVPPGFAHGFATIENDTIFVYKCTNLYHKESEGGIKWNDPDLNINWGVSDPIVSDKDRELGLLKNLRSPF
ncbi:MAG: dTDP-4-dehydrorhamnose 3,5-epimerase [Bacteroidia bacterium]|nr:dTDP-4-dehydrorhamnose 3,5-epimerase [Bacteroidia bacterium]